MRASAASQPGARADHSLREAVARQGRGQRPAGGCRACALGDGTCPSCLRRGVYALGAIERGRELADIASSMRLPVARVRELVRLARDRRELRSYDKRPLLADAQWFINVELARTPGLTRAEIAHRMGMHPSDFDRTFGDAKAGRRRRRFITVTMGDRLMLALGRDPRELDGC